MYIIYVCAEEFPLSLDMGEETFEIYSEFRMFLNTSINTVSLEHSSAYFMLILESSQHCSGNQNPLSTSTVGLTLSVLRSVSQSVARHILGTS